MLIVVSIFKPGVIKIGIFTSGTLKSKELLTGFELPDLPTFAFPVAISKNGNNHR